MTTEQDRSVAIVTEWKDLEAVNGGVFFLLLLLLVVVVFFCAFK